MCGASNQSSYFCRTLNLNVFIAGKRQDTQSVNKEICRSAREVDNIDVDETFIVQYQWALTERMRADWRKNNCRQQWVQDGAAGRKSIGG